MELRNRSVALYGRFSVGTRERLQHEIALRGGSASRDLTRRSDAMVVGALATALIDSGSLGKRLTDAYERNVSVMGERSFAMALTGEKPAETTLPLSTALAPTPLTADDARILAAFDLIALSGDMCRFADAAVIRAAGELLKGGRSRAELVRVLMRARDMAPTGRHKIVLTPGGEAALQWESGLTTLEGQGFLPLELGHSTLDDLFEQAELAEVAGDRDEAARIFEILSSAEKSEPIAPYNLGNIRLAQGRHQEAARAYQRALERDPALVEARYNLAIALEASGRPAQAAEELQRVLALEPAHSDALFNRAQLLMKAGNFAEAKLHYERFLALNPSPDWAATARKAITYCAGRMAG